MLSWLIVFFSFILFACFAEGGDRYYFGNFSWSWNIALSLIYAFTLIEYAKCFDAMRPTVRYMLLAVIVYQLYVGCYYFLGMFAGIEYGDPVRNFPLF
jgi:hypothetical protein